MKNVDVLEVPTARRGFVQGCGRNLSSSRARQTPHFAPVNAIRPGLRSGFDPSTDSSLSVKSVASSGSHDAINFYEWKNGGSRTGTVVLQRHAQDELDHFRVDSGIRCALTLRSPSTPNAI